MYARTLGIPLDPVAATNVLLASLRRRAFRTVGLGGVNGRRFLFHTGLGFDAAVIRRVERYGELKRYASHPLHVLAAFETWFRHFDRSKPRFDLDPRDRRTDRRRLLRDRFEDRAVHATSDPARSSSTPTPVCTPPRAHRLPVLPRHDPVLRGAASAMGSGRYLRNDAGHRAAPRPARAARRGTRSLPVPGGWRRPRRRREPRHRLRRRCVDRRPALTHQANAANATSGTFVMIASTPAVASVGICAGIVDGPHVDLQAELVREARPSRGRRASTRRRDAAMRGRARARAAAATGRSSWCTRNPVRSSGAWSRTASIVPRSNEETTTSASRSRMRSTAGANDDVLGISVGLPRQALHLDVDEHARARFERLRERRASRAARRGTRRTAVPPRARAAPRSRRGGRPGRRRRSGARRAPHRRRRARAAGERGHSVLGRLTVRPTVREDERTGGHREETTRPRRAGPKKQRVPPLSVNVQVRTLARWPYGPLPCAFSLQGFGQRRPDLLVIGRTRRTGCATHRRGN